MTPATLPRSRPIDVQARFQQARPGSVLVLVIAILVLMALIGTAYISTAHVDRYAAQQNSYNTEIELLVQGVVEMTKDAIVTDLFTNFWNASATPHNYTASSDAGCKWLADRVPLVADPTRMADTPASGNNLPYWPYVSASPTSASFESPYVGNNTSPFNATTSATYATVTVPLPGSTPSIGQKNLIPTYIEVTNASGTVRYPALFDKSAGQVVVAADADGDGIADAPLWRLPLGEINGVTYYAAVRVLDNNSTVNAAVAWENNSTPNGVWGDFFPTNVNLKGLIADSTGIQKLNAFRFNGNTPGTAGGQPQTDTGPPPRSDFVFESPYDEVWMQLGPAQQPRAWGGLEFEIRRCPLHGVGEPGVAFLPGKRLCQSVGPRVGDADVAAPDRPPPSAPALSCRPGQKVVR